MKPQTHSIWLHEDWTVVVIGFAIIAAFLTGWIVPAPTYSWNEASQLPELITSDNLIRIAVQFVFIFVLVIAGAWLTGKRVRYYLLVFPVIYLLTVIALVLAGTKN